MIKAIRERRRGGCTSNEIADFAGGNGDIAAMELRNAVQRYLEVAGSYGRPMSLSAFGCGSGELASSLAAWEEDYHLNRHFELIHLADFANGPSFEIHLHGETYNGIVFKESIADVAG